MKIYLIVSGKKAGLSSNQMQSLKKVGEVKIISHKGKLSELKELVNDNDDKILALDPDSFDWNLDVEALDTIQNVKAICTQSTSFDWIKPKELKKRHIIACNCPGFSSDSVAEYALCMAIEASRRLAVYVKNNWKVDWNVKPMLLKGKTAGIIGLGRIGTRMAELCSGIGMKVVYWSRTKRDKRFSYVSLENLFNSSDLIMPALVENAETKTLITHSLLDKVKPTSIIVGINRVKVLLDEEYIIKQIENEKIGGYAFEGDNAQPLSTYQGNVWALPAMAWYTQDSLANLLTLWVENIISVARNNPQNVVN